MDPQDLVEELVALQSLSDRQELLAGEIGALGHDQHQQLAQLLKERADQSMRADISLSLEIASLLEHMADFSQERQYRAMALLVQGNAHVIGLGEYREGIRFYDDAASIYAEAGNVVKQAQSQIGKLWALATLGRYDEALETGEWASGILREHGEWLALAKLTSNLAAIHGRLSQDREALAMFDQTRDSYRQLGDEGELPRRRVEINRAIVLRNLGRFEESITTNQTVLDDYLDRWPDQLLAIARAQQNLGVTYFLLGRYNEALTLFDEASDAFLADGRERHAMLVELFVSDCLLQLRRFPDVLEKCAQVRLLFNQRGMRLEVARAILNEASANASLGRYTDALTSLEEARELFLEETNPVAVADADLQTARVRFSQEEFSQSLATAQYSAGVFESHSLPVDLARALLVAARAAIALDQFEKASDLVNRALKIGEKLGIPTLSYQGHHLHGSLALKQQQPERGLAAFEKSIEELERLYGRLMIEHRADFAADKSSVYEDIVALCLDLDLPRRGLEYSERAKSRALLDLVAHRLDLRVEVRSESDQPLVDQLLRLRAERDRLYRRWETGEPAGRRGNTGEILTEGSRVEQDVLALEDKITALWHKLLVRNADYARDAALWSVRTEPVEPYLGKQTVLLEYFIAHGRIIAFLVTSDGIHAQWLGATESQVFRLLQLLWLNLKAVPRSSVERLTSLTTNVQGVLGQLHELLIEPVAPKMGAYRNIIIVPHGSLHYLPFHALYDGGAYLLERYEISYLPGASLLRYCQEVEPAEDGLLSVGHSCRDRLPNAIEEAKSIAGIWTGQALVEADATLSEVRRSAPQSRILHLATHGDFRPDNPVFSGLFLEDGWLTTLDIFNLPLSASLVTLSACQTGRSVVGGGDELLGLTRAILGAGAASLVATLWAVEDISTSNLMQTFYRKLFQGETKGQALRDAQLAFIQDRQLGRSYRHPYFWAPFMLVGDSGPV